MFGSLVVDRTDINANTDAHRGGDGNLAEVLALRGSRLQLVELVDESHQVLLEAVSREGGTTDRGVDDTSLVGAELDLTGLGVLLTLNSGLRLGELCALRWSDIDLHAGFLRVEREVQRIYEKGCTRLIVQPPKSESSLRRIPLPTDILSLLAAHRPENAGSFCLLTSSGDPLEPRTMQNRYRSLLKRAGVPYRNFHALRHTYATRCIEQNVDVKSISEMLGHSDVRITLQTYVHVSLRHKQQAVQSICFLPICGNADLAPSEIPSGAAKAAARHGAAARVS